jgi:hypothetical protein
VLTKVNQSQVLIKKLGGGYRNTLPTTSNIPVSGSRVKYRISINFLNKITIYSPDFVEGRNVKHVPNGRVHPQVLLCVVFS